MIHLLKRFFYYLTNRPRSLFAYIFEKIFFFLDDEIYLKILFYIVLNKKLDLLNPKSFSEKMQWLKLYNRKPEYTRMVDKYEAKKYVADIIGEEYIIPTLGVWDKFEDINFNELPDKFVLKTTHGGGSFGVVICDDKEKFDKRKCKEKISRSLRQNIYKQLREWPYKDVKPQILAEQYMSDSVNRDLPDYKFYCFNGEPIYCQVIRDRKSKETIDFYDMDWNHMQFVGLNPVAKNGLNPVAKPVKLVDMIELCKRLSQNIPFVRIDMYVINDKIYFGEITFFPASGMGIFTPDEWNYKLGDLIVEK